MGVVTCQDFGAEVVDYLTQFGYLPTSDAGAKSFVAPANLFDAVEKFQSFAGLNPTGELDNGTLELMKTPRCGKEDNVLQKSVAQGIAQRDAKCVAQRIAQRVAQHVAKRVA